MLFFDGREERRDEGSRKWRLNVLTGSHLLMVGPLGENLGFGCVSGVALIGPIARCKEAG